MITLNARFNKKTEVSIVGWRRNMDIVIVVSLIFAFGSLILGFILEGGTITALLQITALIIVLGGTLGATGVSFQGHTLKKFGKYLGIAFKKRNSSTLQTIEYFKELSGRTRREGLLILESELAKPDVDKFIKKGLQLVVDGVEQTLIKSVLETRLEQISERHEDGIEVFTVAGGYAPTMGIIGTVMGLVQVVSNLEDPSVLGHKIAAAFMATLYGIATANLFWLPIATKLKMLNKEEMIEKEMIIEAILLIQQGANTNTLVSKLEGYLDSSSEGVIVEDK